MPGPVVAVASPPAPPAGPSSGAGFGTALRAAGVVEPSSPRATPPGAAAPAGPGAPLLSSPPGSAASAARQALHSIERAQRRLDAVLEAARRGRTFTAQELLVLQAETYRCAQTLDVASKAVEHAAQSVKQAANAQV